MRKIIHIDMDAFFAAVEQRDDPSLRGKPVIVGGDPDKRGVVATASYEARAFGIHSAMPAATARRLCPTGVFLRPRMPTYREVSRQVMDVLHAYTDQLEPVSIDEAYLDVTQNKAGLSYASQVARAIKDDIIKETQLTASAGVGPNKFIAKVASDLNKPDGLTVIRPEDVPELLRELPVRKVPGIGPATGQRLADMGISVVGDLRKWPEDELVATFGKAGHWFYALARGQDDREVQVSHVRKSIGAETTFDVDLSDLEDMHAELKKLAGEVQRRMERNDVRGRTITLKMTHSDFTKVTRSATLDAFHGDAATLYETTVELLEQSEAPNRPVRLLGISVSNLDNIDEDSTPAETGPQQLTFPFFGHPRTP